MVVDELQRGREAGAAEAWTSAFELLSAADRSAALDGRDLELLATAAYMIGDEDGYLLALERAHRVSVDAGRPLTAVRCAFWIGVTLARRGAQGAAGGWLSRARRLLAHEPGEHVEHGYLLIPDVFEQEARGDWEAAAATARAAAAIGERFGDADLFALAAHEHGHILIAHGHAADGLALLDEAMVAVTSGELSPIVSGIVYCGVILACQDAFEVRRAREWTAALTRWCERQPDLVAFTGRCLVHRAEILQLDGSWRQALAEAGRAKERSRLGGNAAAAGEAAYREGELHRLLGDVALAEQAYREAHRDGREPQPGLALLRLAEGRHDAAAAAIRRLRDDPTGAGRRADVLLAAVEIMIAVGDPGAAGDAARELAALAAGQADGALGAMAAHARGAVDLARGDARAALAALRHAIAVGQRLGARYEVARARVLVGLACRMLGDSDAAELELQSARAALTDLGAGPDVARVESLLAAPPADAYGLTGRELEVLRHLAAGATNRAIAAELVLSVRTVDRHVSNILAKLGVASRSGATALAHRRRIV